MGRTPEARDRLRASLRRRAPRPVQQVQPYAVTLEELEDGDPGERVRHQTRVGCLLGRAQRFPRQAGSTGKVTGHQPGECEFLFCVRARPGHPALPPLPGGTSARRAASRSGGSRSWLAERAATRAAGRPGRRGARIGSAPGCGPCLLRGNDSRRRCTIRSRAASERPAGVSRAACSVKAAASSGAPLDAACLAAPSSIPAISSLGLSAPRARCQARSSISSAAAPSRWCTCLRSPSGISL